MRPECCSLRLLGELPLRPQLPDIFSCILTSVSPSISCGSALQKRRIKKKWAGRSMDYAESEFLPTETGKSSTILGMHVLWIWWKNRISSWYQMLRISCHNLQIWYSNASWEYRRIKLHETLLLWGWRNLCTECVWQSNVEIPPVIPPDNNDYRERLGRERT